MTADLKEIRAVLTDKFLAQRPSLKRVQARLVAKGMEPIDRTDYQVLMQEIYTLRALFKHAEVKVPEDADVVRFKVNYWGNSSNPNFQVKAELKPKGPEVLKALRANKIAVKVKSTTLRLKGDSVPEIVSVPDMHFGYRVIGEVLDPIHDEAAIACMLEVLRYLQPRVIVFDGDNLDFAGFSSFLKHPSLLHLANAAVQRLYEFLYAVRSACPNARIVYMEGNHEFRAKRYLQERAPEFVGLCRGGTDKEVTAVDYLLRLDELNIEYVGDYGKRTWIGDILALHGELLGKTGGETAAKMLNEYVESSFCGHNHRLELAFKTRTTRGKRVRTFAATCGTLARIDGSLPGSKYPDAQQGFLIVWDEQNPQVVPIDEGKCRIGPVRFEAVIGE